MRKPYLIVIPLRTGRPTSRVGKWLHEIGMFFLACVYLAMLAFFALCVMGVMVAAFIVAALVDLYHHWFGKAVRSPA